MPEVTVQPSGLVLDVHPDESVFAAARRSGYSWPTTCGGLADCGSCISLVTDGLEHCAPAAAQEAETLGRVRPGHHGEDARFRLACQLRVHGPVTLTRRGVRRV